MPISATTGHHFRHHNDQENYLDVLYTMVLTGKAFIKLQNLTGYCALSSFCMRENGSGQAGPGLVSGPTINGYGLRFV